MEPLQRFLIVSAVLFATGLYGALSLRNVVVVLMGIELMFNGVNVAMVALSRYVVPATLAANPGSATDSALRTVLTGQVFAAFIITVAAAEVAVGLAIVLALYRSRETVDITDASSMKQ
ncbi:MAG: NADH-quinone oxidoreductase subunit NuoK [Chloroflexi bacterium]|nr:NADH-quinone oxidoreductase subunit NuoK [Chloroflexota bacterium]